jgi:hypothetical protein
LPPGSGFSFLTLPPKLLPVARRQADGACPKLGPGGMSTTGLLDAISGSSDGSVKKKSTFEYGIYGRKRENSGSERCILRRKVASLHISDYSTLLANLCPFLGRRERG